MSTLFLRRKANQQKANNTIPLQQFATGEALEDQEPGQEELDMSAFHAGLNKAVEQQNENNVQEDSLSDE